MKKIAHCIHHTHWDLIWYFTVQDATVQFSYNMKEMLKGFRNERITDFFMDGQTAPIDEYLLLHPEDREEIKQLVSEGKLIIGPFNSQLDCFISSGESVINNLRLGIKTCQELGKISKVAYLPDSFGHSYDFPKIFQQFGIHDFVITRGVGDDYDLDSEFYMESNDGSQLLVCTMIAGYGYGCYAFKNGTLFEDSAKDYNKISVQSLIERLLSYSTIENEFVFPLGFDQNPVMLDIKERMDSYNKEDHDIEFQSTNWQEFCNRVRKKGKHLKTHKGELFSTQYHRVHRSIFSARADIKGMQDQCERILTYGLQPMMTILDSLGIEYDHGLIDSCWERLVKCQTHSSATLTDETNNYIERETKNVLNQLKSHQTYLCKLMSISLEENYDYPLIIFNPLPYQRKQTIHTKIQTKFPYFKIEVAGNVIPYTLVSTIKKNCGVLRKNPALIDSSKYYYESEIIFTTCFMEGLSYQVYEIKNNEAPSTSMKYMEGLYQIENDYYKIYHDQNGIHIYDKKRKKLHKNAIFLEESGDEGDSFDYSYPNFDWILKDSFVDAKIDYQECCQEKKMCIDGVMKVPMDLQSRKQKICDAQVEYHIELKLTDVPYIEISGFIDNHAKAHRMRLVITTEENHTESYAGTQYGYIKRETNPESLTYWKERQWFEEPSPTWPLLNHVSVVGQETVTVFTKWCKEYEIINDGFKDIALTLFRSYGAMGYPDLNRRPGRPSGLDYRVFETPECQMMKKNIFSFALEYGSSFDANKICNDYISYACEPIIFEGQSFDKSIDPITYFPTNPLDYKLPLSYSLLQLEQCEGSFGTIVKDDNEDAYIMRLYNNEEKEVEMGIVRDKRENTIQIVNLDGTLVKKVENQLPKMKKGELINLEIKH